MSELAVMTGERQEPVPVGHVDAPATQQEYDDRVAGLAEVIDAAEPDVLALQEVGPEHAPADLNAACSIDFDNRLVGSSDDRRIRVALLSPRPLSDRVDITTFPLGVVPVQSRPHLRQPGHARERRPIRCARTRWLVGQSTHRDEQPVMVAHLKSKLISYARQPGVVGGSMFARTMSASVCGMPAMRSTAGPRRPWPAKLPSTRYLPRLAISPRGHGHGAGKPADLLRRPEGRTPGCNDRDHPRSGGLGDDFRPGSGFRTATAATRNPVGRLDSARRRGRRRRRCCVRSRELALTPSCSRLGGRDR